MRTIADIVQDLIARAAAGADVRQQLASYQAIAQFTAELHSFDHKASLASAERAAGLRQQIGMHARMVDELPAELADPAPAAPPAPAPPALADELPSAAPVEQAGPARPARAR